MVLAQLWKTDYDDTFQGKLEKIYELDYKYHTIKSSDFQGHPKAKDNILLGFERELREAIDSVCEVLEIVFRDWLSKHALLNPSEWTNERFREINESDGDYSSGEEAIWDYICSECNEFIFKNGINSETQLRTATLREIFKRDSSFFSGPLERLRQRTTNDIEIESSPYEDSEDPDERQEYLDSLDRLKEINESDESFLKYIFFYDYEEYFMNMFNLEELRVIVRDFIFPLWYEYWSNQGIDNTRDTVEEAYKIMNEIPSLPISKATSALNYVLNVSHQTGDMLEHVGNFVSEYLEEKFDYKLLDKLSNLDTSKWDNDLSGDYRIQLNKQQVPIY